MIDKDGLFKRIESIEYQALCLNTNSARLMIETAAETPEYAILVENSSITPEDILLRIYELQIVDVDPKYLNPNDNSISIYITALADKLAKMSHCTYFVQALYNQRYRREVQTT